MTMESGLLMIFTRELKDIGLQPFDAVGRLRVMLFILCGCMNFAASSASRPAMP